MMKYKWIFLGILIVFLISQWPLENEGSAYRFNKEIPKQIELNTGDYITIDEISPELINMLVAAEDKRFYQHGGFDLVGIGRALYQALETGEFHSGGSTLTQQLAKNLFLNQDKTLSRKARELILAVKLEHAYSKEEILEMYLNVVYFGQEAYGIKAASNVYFKEDPKDLTLEQSAILIGLLPAPSLYNPVVNLDLSQKKAETILRLVGKSSN